MTENNTTPLVQTSNQDWYKKHGIDDTNAEYTVFCLVGEQPIPNILLIEDLINSGYKNIKIVLIYSEKDDNIKDVKDNISNYCEKIPQKYENRFKVSIEIINVPITEKEHLYDITQIQNDIENNLKDYDFKNPVFNITGGNKVMSCALLDFALKQQNKVIFYIDGNNIYDFNGKTTPINENLLTIEDYKNIMNRVNYRFIEYKNTEQYDKNIKYVIDYLSKNYPNLNKYTLDKDKIFFVHENTLCVILVLENGNNLKDLNNKKYKILEYRETLGLFVNLTIIVPNRFFYNQNRELENSNKNRTEDIMKFDDINFKELNIKKPEKYLQIKKNIKIIC